MPLVWDKNFMQQKESLEILFERLEVLLFAPLLFIHDFWGWVDECFYQVPN